MIIGRLPSDQDSSGRNLGEEELAFLQEVIESGTLTATKGRMVKLFAEEFARMLGARHAIACSSGTAAIHAAVAALDPEPGDEIITSPITDMGALAPILYQGAIPVFADVDPRTGNVTADTIAARLSDRTKAIVVTHLFGNPCEMARDYGCSPTGTACPSWKTAPRRISPRPAAASSARSAPSGASASSRGNTSRRARGAWS